MVLSLWGDGTMPDAFYRAVVLKDVVLKDESVPRLLVHFVDYGNRDVVPLQRVRSLPKDLAPFPMQVRLLLDKGAKGARRWSDDNFTPSLSTQKIKLSSF